MQWMQYAVDAVRSRCSMQYAVCSTQWNSGTWWWAHCLWCKKVKPEDTVDAVHSGIVVYGGGGTLSLVQKGQTSGRSGHSTQYAVCSMQWNSGIWWRGHCLWCKNVKPEDTVDAVHSGIVVYGGGDIVFGAKRSNQRMPWMQYTVE